MTRWLFFLFLSGCLPCSLTAQDVCLSVGVHGTANGPGFTFHSFALVANTFLSENSDNPVFTLPFLTNILLTPPQPMSVAKGDLLPKWSPESLPFFCRVEHDWGKKLPFAFKFRLGSVEYVDWLEGKTSWMSQ